MRVYLLCCLLCYGGFTTLLYKVGGMKNIALHFFVALVKSLGALAWVSEAFCVSRGWRVCV